MLHPRIRPIGCGNSQCIHELPILSLESSTSPAACPASKFCQTLGVRHQHVPRRRGGTAVPGLGRRVLRPWLRSRPGPLPGSWFAWLFCLGVRNNRLRFMPLPLSVQMPSYTNPYLHFLTKNKLAVFEKVNNSLFKFLTPFCCLLTFGGVALLISLCLTLRDCNGLRSTPRLGCIFDIRRHVGDVRTFSLCLPRVAKNNTHDRMECMWGGKQGQWLKTSSFPKILHEFTGCPTFVVLELVSCHVSRNLKPYHSLLILPSDQSEQSVCRSVEKDAPLS